MSQRMNEHGQPIGVEVPNWTGCDRPDDAPMEGRFCRVERLDPVRHGADLFDAFTRDATGQLWTYMPVGPFVDDRAGFDHWLAEAARSTDPLFHTIIDTQSGQAVGFASYLRIAPQAGTIEVGFIAFSPLLQRTPLATEAMFLMMKRVFRELGYRRYEWKCDALNAPSKRAAQRLGFTYDGTFEQALVYKGRNRDTAWFSILDRDWPGIEAGFGAWLAPENFDDLGQQRLPLGDLMSKHRT
ncbi:GNAT family N-acetyltransferase [Tropicibacter sp. Alg240-R139]|uniref:GNAT family N-acetyltransferase n=1 Tax=Tropicibacter sp. Alg240-R139 TaxID=2305991 RepID=UPI0013DF98D1|nr:GNAT family protein [Tropicibacter sp. Alg240-R139]